MVRLRACDAGRRRVQRQRERGCARSAAHTRKLRDGVRRRGGVVRGGDLGVAGRGVVV